MQKAVFSVALPGTTDDATARQLRHERDTSSLADVQRENDHARDVALDVLALLAGLADHDATGFDQEEATAPGMTHVEPSRAASADEEVTAPDALADLSLRELAELVTS